MRKKWLTFFAVIALSLAGAGCSFSSSNGSSSGKSSQTAKNGSASTDKNGGSSSQSGGDSSNSGSSSSSQTSADNSGSSQSKTDQGSSDDQTSSNSDSSTSKDKPLTPEQVIQAVSKQLKTDVPVRLPKEVPLDKGYHLTAVTKSDSSHYTVTFYESKTPIPINNSKLTNGNNALEIGIIKGTLYKTADQAENEIQYQEFSKNNAANPSVDLGHGIKGYLDAGLGSEYLSWNEGRWSFMVRARTGGDNKPQDLGKEIVQYLEKAMLPPPHVHGAAHFSAVPSDVSNQRIDWQMGKTVYEVSNTKGALKALEMASSISE